MTTIHVLVNAVFILYLSIIGMQTLIISSTRLSQQINYDKTETQLLQIHNNSLNLYTILLALHINNYSP